MDQTGRAYNDPLALCLRGALNSAALATALGILVERHAILRTIFPVVDGVACQKIQSEGSVPLTQHDLSHVPSTERELAVRRLLEDEVRTPFDLGLGPLLRATLVRTSDEEHVFVCVFHHILTDGWSMQLFQRELAAVYSALIEGRPVVLPPLSIDYADYAAWQQSQVEGEEQERQREYWRQALDGVEGGVDLPLDRPRPAIASHKGAAHGVRLGESLSARVRQLAREECATPFMVFLAAFNVLLFRYTGQSDLLVGTPVAARTRPETECLFGAFVNTLLIRTQIAKGLTGRQLVAVVRDSVLRALEHQDLPFERVAAQLNARAGNAVDLGLLRVMFALETTPTESVALPGLSVERVDLDLASAKCDLMVWLTEQASTFSGFIEYATDLFDSETIQRLEKHFLRLVEGLVTAPDEPLSRLPLLGPDEEEKVVREWNRTEADYPQEPLHRVFEERASATPEATALLYGDKAWSYAELNDWANQISGLLRSRDVQRGDLVGIIMPRSPSMIATILGILKSGAAYLPLDPATPSARLDVMLEEAQPRYVVLSETGSIDVRRAGVPTLVLPDERECLTGQDPRNPSEEASQDDLAYVMFTSGSTGKPKGVEVTHRAICRLLFGGGYCRLGPTETLLHLAPASFDASTFELWGALLHGAKCVLFPEELPTVDTLGSALERYRVSTLWLTSSLFNLVVDDAPQILKGVSQLLTGGEALSVRHVRRAYEQLPHIQLINGYGPTESTTFAACYPIPRDLPPHIASVPIGRPIGNTRLYVLDGERQPAPIGVPGELYIGGDGVAVGYRNDSALTNSRFVPDPFVSNRDGRLYRTGDLVKWLPDGTLDFIGRIDRQAKIRGHRIEPGEIEAVLGQHPDLAQCAVVVREHPEIGKHLAAYVVPSGVRRPVGEELRWYLGTRLPDYLVPDHWVVLESLPLTANGKLDHRALPEPKEATPGAGRTPPQSELECKLAQVWCDLLRVDNVALEDRFFSLGGHSLLAVRMTSRIEQIFGVRLSPRTLYEAPTLAACAARIEAAHQQFLPDSDGGDSVETSGDHTPSVVACIPRLKPVDARCLSFTQQRLWLLDRLEPSSHAYNMQSAFRLRGRLQTGALRRALNEIVRRHEVLRSIFPIADGMPTVAIEEELQLELAETDLSHLEESAQNEAIRQKLERSERDPFELHRGPLIRAQLITLGEDHHVLVVTKHHIVSDGWSWEVLGTELGALYSAYAAGDVSPLPDLPLQYPDFASWQRARLEEDPSFQSQLGYWKQRLAGAPPRLDIPTDRPRPNHQNIKGGKQHLTLSAPLVQRLRELASSHNATLFMLLLATFALLLARWSESNDVVVGAPIADRRHPEMEGLIGPFLNNLALRVELAEVTSFSELLCRTRQTVLEAFENQDVPFERVVEILNPERDQARHPIFEVMLNYVTNGHRNIHLEGLEVSQLPPAVQSSKLPMTLYVEPCGEQITLTLAYQTALFEDGSMQHLLDQLHALLEQATKHPDAPLEGYSLVTAASAAVLPNPSAPIAQSRYEDLVVTLNRIILEMPDAEAVRQAGRSWSYRELDQAASAVGWQLNGIDRGAVVAVTGRRCFGLIAAVTAVLRSGGALLTLDPELPLTRRELMLEEARAAFLLVVGDEIAIPELPARCRVITVASTPAAQKSSSKATLSGPLAFREDDPAYVFFTSGSTGKPKAVLGRRSGLAHFLTWQRTTFRVTRGDRLAQLTGLSFDVVLRDLLLPLTSGATLCLPTGEDVQEPDRLFTWFETERISLLHTVPSRARAWLAGLNRQYALDALRLVFFAGEPLTSELVGAWRTQFPGFGRRGQVVNLYGPTETTLAKCFYQVLPEARPGVQPLGQCLPETQALVLRGDWQCGVREPGEIALRTPFRSLGYLNAPDEHATRFITNPFTQDSDDLLYRTGDLGYYAADGSLMILRRVDTQVKIRGVRIEPGEIEHALKMLPGVRDAAVQPYGSADNLRLAAYVVLEGDTANMEPLRSALQRVLPAHHIPAVFIPLPAMPLTANGKLDRRSLPVPAPREANSAAAKVPPRDDIESRLLDIWEALLGVPHLSIEDDFFAVGGHSLLAVQLMGRVQREFGCELPLASLLQASTVEAMARTIRCGDWRSEFQSLIPIQPNGTRTPFFAVHGIGGGVLCYRALAELLGDDQPFYGLQAASLGGRDAEYDRVEDMAAHYLREVRSVQPHGPYQLGGLSFGGNIALEMAQQLEAAGEQVLLLALFDSKGPGYPQYPGTALRIAAQVKRFLEQKPEQRWSYIVERIDALGVIVRRGLLSRHYGRAKVMGIDRALTDIGIAHVHAGLTYERRPYPGAITLFRAEVQPVGCVLNPTNGWEHIALGGVDVQQVPGEHASIIEPPHVSVLAAKLQACLTVVSDNGRNVDANNQRAHCVGRE